MKCWDIYLSIFLMTTTLTNELLNELEQSVQSALDPAYDSIHSDVYGIVCDFAEENDLDPDDLINLVSGPHIRIIRN